MPTVTITELERSGSAEDSANGYVTLEFHAVGSDNYTDVVAAIPGTIPDIYNNLARQSIEREPVGGGHWFLRARYAAAVQNNPPLQYGDPERLTWESTGTTVRRTHAEVVGTFSLLGYDVPDNGEAINVTNEGIEGVDIEYGYGRLTIESVITEASASTAYGLTLATHVKKAVNASAWRGFDAGQARFVDYRMSSRGDGYWDLTRVFDVDANVTGGTFAGVSGIDKKAHEYLWALSERTEDTTAKRVVEKTFACTVHRIYPEINFSVLEP